MEVSRGPNHSSLSTGTLGAVLVALTESGQFGPVVVGPTGLEAQATREGAFYRLTAEADGLFVGLVSADRWLSQSIEQQLVISGDKLEDLLEEELIDLDAPLTRLKVEHFRDDAKLFTFRSRLPSDLSAESIARIVRGYEACFRRLGDMEGGADE